MSLPKYGALHPNMVKNANFRGLHMQNLRVFALYIARGYNSAAESTSLLSSVASLAITFRRLKENLT